ncbi:MAG: T9SS type A sorting domain-containing protein [Fluviicola sp.]|nr:T9SS type A sorting domain-containing protein [Fluviicola sp.]
MKRFLLNSSLFLSVSCAFSQQSDISINNVSAVINNNGTFFHDYGNQTAGYEIPKNSGKNAIYFMNLMGAGMDPNGQLKAALSDYVSTDFFPGPYVQDFQNYQTPAYVSRFSESLWVIEKTTIDDHIAHWNDAGYVVPTSISNWPGNGDVTNGESLILAPFEDLDGDNLYEPETGEYPIIRGDKAILSILNDGAGIHPSGAQRIGLELHILFYQYNSVDPAINNTTFIHSRWYNRGTQTLSDFKVGSSIDFDLGNSQDDYYGTAPAHNLAYVYNADLNDESNGGLPGYGVNPPAVGIVALNTGLTSHVPLTGGPNSLSPIQYHNLLSGYDNFGSYFYDDNNQITTYMYNEEGVNGWNQYTEGLAPEDVRTVAGFDTGISDGIFRPLSSFCLDLAVVYAENPSSDFFGSVAHLITVADSVQAFYDTQMYECQSTLSLEQADLVSVELFPNPTTGFVTLKGAENVPFEVHSTDGKLILREMKGASFIDLSHVQAGIYTITFSTGTSAKICKQ